MTIITKTRDGQWEQAIFTDKDEILDFNHEPKVEDKPRQDQTLTPEKIEFFSKKWKDPQARERRRREPFGGIRRRVQQPQLQLLGL